MDGCRAPGASQRHRGRCGGAGVAALSNAPFLLAVFFGIEDLGEIL
jgi:hypothetical protein